MARQGYRIRVLTSRSKETVGSLSYPAEIFCWIKSAHASDPESTSVVKRFNDKQTEDKPTELEIPLAAIEGCDLVVNLAGAGIADSRWSEKRKKIIQDSRILTTRALARALVQLKNPPKVVIQGSAVGYYSGLSSLDLEGASPSQEECEPGRDFLATTCSAWENELTTVAKGPNWPDKTRVVILRTGVVLGWGGGALDQLGQVYGCGLGGVLGSGRQWMNWIHVSDWVQAVLYVISHQEITGSLNLVAPGNVTNRQFHHVFKKFYSLTSPVPVPSFMLKLTLGARAQLLLEGERISCARLEGFGFSFQYGQLETALHNLYCQVVQKNSHVFRDALWLDIDSETAWKFFSDEQNLEAITPPELKFKVLGKNTESIGSGTLIDYQLRLHGIPFRWRTEIKNWNKPVEFVDVQLRGPYQLWHHTHRFTPLQSGVLMEDLVCFRLPLFPISIVGHLKVISDIRRIFKFRRKRVPQLLSRGSMNE